MAGTERRTGEDQARPSVRTGCGRTLAVGCLTIEGPARPVARVTLDIGPYRSGAGTVWVSLTPAEARLLAQHLLEQAAAADPGTA